MTHVAPTTPLIALVHLLASIPIRVATGRAERDCTVDLRGALPAVTVGHFAAITEPAKIGELLRAIDGYVGQPATHAALKLAPYVFVRRESFVKPSGESST